MVGTRRRDTTRDKSDRVVSTEQMSVQCRPDTLLAIVRRNNDVPSGAIMDSTVVAYL